MVEAPAAEARETAAEHSNPDLARLGVHVDGGDDLPRQPVGLSPGLDVARAFVDSRQAVLGTHPYVRAGDLYREDVIIREAVGDGELLPPGVDVGQLLGGYRRNEKNAQHYAPESDLRDARP